MCWFVQLLNFESPSFFWLLLFLSILDKYGCSAILTTMVVNIIERLRELGFSEYEARVYVNLISRSPATPYEAAKAAGVPTSKIYEVLGRLAEKGLVMELSENGKRRYIPMEPDDFMESYRSKMDVTLGSLKRDFSQLRGETNISYIWNIQNADDFREHALRMICGAKKSILVSAWAEEMSALESSLKERQKDIDVAVVHFGEPEKRIGATFVHPIADTLFTERGGRGFAVVADGREALMATFGPDGGIEGAWSRNRGFALLAEDYIKHDIYIMKIVSRFNSLLVDRFGEGYAKLRDVFRDEENV